MTTETFTVDLDSGSTTATRYPATGAQASALFVFAHGAGAGQRHPFMTRVAAGLAERGIDVVTFDFPYVAQKRKVPDRAPVLEACFERVIAAARQRTSGRTSRLFIGGKSMGGRMATHLAARQVPGIAGVIALGYPLHPPGKAHEPRTAHLPAITCPVLIIQGERDTFGTPTELAPVLKTMTAPVTLHPIASGDHSLKVPVRLQEAVNAGVLETMVSWMTAIPA